jgi:N-methylhydantoinase A
LAYVIGVDTGGTFTDVVALDEAGKLIRAKALSTPPEFDRGILAALDNLAERIGITTKRLLQETSAFCFGTTVATNALWTRTGAKVGMLVTRGFEDTHHIARGVSKWAGLPEAEIKHQTVIRKPEPLVSKDFIIGVDERVDWAGQNVVPLDRGQVKKAADVLVQKGAESIAICYLWSIKKMEHEIESVRVVRESYPDLYVTHSAGVAPTLGEYERFNNAIVDAYIGPVTVRFLNRLAEQLRTAGLRCELLTVKADGGSALISGALPLATIHSGPAAGVLGAKFIGGVLGENNIITADVGGTSFDVSLINEGRLFYTREPVLEKFSCTYPSLEIKSIGAGGGSIIWPDPRVKTIGVGPRSAGASPGPACYGFGGTEPTVTDANVVLGYFDPEYFLGGRMKLYPERARDALKKVGDKVGMSVIDVAAGTYHIVNAHCTDLIRLFTVERGFDPRDFTLFVFGGCGPAHGIEWAIDLGVKKVVIAPFASEYSALGIALSEVVHTNQYFDYSMMPMDVDIFNGAFEKSEKMLKDHFTRQGIDFSKCEVDYLLYCKYPTVYAHQRVPIPRRQYTAKDMEEFIPSAFDTEYEVIYGKGSAMASAGREIVGFEVRGTYQRIKPSLKSLEMKGPDASQALRGERDAYFYKLKKFIKTKIYDHGKLEPGNVVEGPAILEAIDMTVVIPPGVKADVDGYSNVIARL